MTQITDLEKSIRTEYDAAFAALQTALQHAVNAGIAVAQVRDLLAENPWQRWIKQGSPIGQHKSMVMWRISKCENMKNKNQTLADLMFDRAAEYISQDLGVPSKAERMAAHRSNDQNSNPSVSMSEPND